MSDDRKKYTITHENFEKAMELTRKGEAVLYIPTYTQCTVIDAKVIKRFEKAGAVCLKKSDDGKGFRVARGKKFDYVMPGYLKAMAA